MANVWPIASVDGAQHVGRTGHLQEPGRNSELDWMGAARERSGVAFALPQLFPRIALATGSD